MFMFVLSYCKRYCVSGQRSIESGHAVKSVQECSANSAIRMQVNQVPPSGIIKTLETDDSERQRRESAPILAGGTWNILAQQTRRAAKIESGCARPVLLLCRLLPRDTTRAISFKLEQKKCSLAKIER